ncbi:uncharacterized protein RBU57_016951 [Macrochelys suwanniensis]
MAKCRFRLVSPVRIIPSLDPGDCYAALDLQDTYFHIYTFEGHRRFLRFLVGPDHYQFTVLPFGLSTAPRVFTKCMAVVAAYLRRRGVQIFPYLDDWLLKGSSRSQVQDHLELFLSTCANLGLLVNEAKSTLVPVQCIEFIGALLDASKATASLPLGRFQTLKVLIGTVTELPVTTARACLQLLGHMYLRGPPRQTPDEAPPALAGLGVLPGLGQAGQSPHGTGASDRLTTMVVLPGQYAPGDPLPGPAPVTRPSVRCVGLGLGGPHRELTDPRDVVGLGVVPSYKCQGAQGDTLSLWGVQLTTMRQGGQSTHGQHRCDVLHQQAGRDKVLGSLPGSP